MVTEAPNGQKRLRQFRQTPTALVITDLLMPDIDGLEVTMVLHRESPTVKIIVLTGGLGQRDFTVPSPELVVSCRPWIPSLQRDKAVGRARSFSSIPINSTPNRKPWAQLTAARDTRRRLRFGKGEAQVALQFSPGLDFLFFIQMLKRISHADFPNLSHHFPMIVS